MFQTDHQPEHLGQVSMVILKPEQGVQLYEGGPDDYGLDEASVYVKFVYGRLLVTVWLTGELEPYERRLVSRQILDYVKDKTPIM